MFNLYAENGKKNKIYFTEREIKKTNTHAAFEAFHFWHLFNFVNATGCEQRRWEKVGRSPARRSRVKLEMRFQLDAGSCLKPESCSL